MNALADDWEKESGTIADVLAWHRLMVSQGRLDREKARLRRTALIRMTGLLGGDPSRHDAARVLHHLDELEEELIKHPSKGVSRGTARSYKSRSAAAINDYIRYRKHPGRMPTGRAKKRSPTVDAEVELSELPLTHGRSFRYSLPPTFTRRDLNRIYFHLLSQVSDIDDVGQEVHQPVQTSLEDLIPRQTKEVPSE